jgi:hypothetical protein
MHTLGSACHTHAYMHTLLHRGRRAMHIHIRMHVWANCECVDLTPTNMCYHVSTTCLRKKSNEPCIGHPCHQCLQILISPQVSLHLSWNQAKASQHVSLHLCWIRPKAKTCCFMRRPVTQPAMFGISDKHDNGLCHSAVMWHQYKVSWCVHTYMLVCSWQALGTLFAKNIEDIVHG